MQSLQSVTWLAVRGKSADVICSDLGLRQGMASTHSKRRFALEGARSDAGWFLIVADGLDHRLIQPPVLATLSAGCEVLTCTVDERNLYSVATGWANGRQVVVGEVRRRGSPRRDRRRGRSPAQLRVRAEGLRRPIAGGRCRRPAAGSAVRDSDRNRYAARSSSGPTSRARRSMAGSSCSKRSTRPSCNASLAVDRARARRRFDPHDGAGHNEPCSAARSSSLWSVCPRGQPPIAWARVRRRPSPRQPVPPRPRSLGLTNPTRPIVSGRRRVEQTPPSLRRSGRRSCTTRRSRDFTILTGPTRLVRLSPSVQRAIPHITSTASLS